MGQVVRSSTGSVGVSKCAVAEAELKRLRGELKKLRKEIHSRASVREDKEIQVRSADDDAKEIDRLRIQIKKLTDTHEADRIRTLDEKNAALDKVIADKDKESSVLLAQIEETERQVERSNELVSSLESERNDLHRKLNERQSRAVKARDLTRKIDAEMHKNARLKIRLAKLRSDQQTAAKKAAASNEAEVHRLTAEMSDVQSRLGEAILRSSDLQEQLDKLNTAHTDLTRSDNYKNAKIAELAASLQQEMTKISELEATLSTLKQEIETLNSEIANIKQDRDQAQGQLRQRGVLNDGLTKQLSEANETINASLAKLKQSLDNAASLEKEAKNTKENALELTRENSGLRSQLGDLQLKLIDRQLLVEEQGNKSTKNEEEISRLNDEIQRITLQIKERDERIASLQQKLSDYGAKMDSILQEQSKDKDDLNSTISDITRLLEKANASKSEMSESLDKSTVRVATIKSELDKEKEKVRVLNSRVIDLQRTMETDVRKHKGVLEAATKEKRATDERNKRLMSDLTAELEGKTAELTEMGETLKSKELELETSKSRLSEVTGLLRKETTELNKLKDNLSELSGRILNQSALQQQIKSTTESLQVQSELNAKLQQQVDVATAELSKVEKEASALNDLLSRVKSAASCERSSDIVACIKDKMEHRMRLEEELRQCKERAEADAQRLNSEISVMLSTIQTKEETLQTVQRGIESLKKEKTEDREKKAKEISGLQKREALLTGQLADANGKITELKARFDEAANNAQKKIAGIKDLIARNNHEHNSDLDRARAALEQKQNELTESREKEAGLLRTLKQASDLSDQELSALRRDLDIRNKENDGLRKEMADFQEKLNELAKLKEEAEARYKATQTTLQEINEQVDGLLGATTKRSDELEGEDSDADHTAERIGFIAKEYRSTKIALSALGEKAQCRTGSKDDVIRCLNRTIEVSNAVQETIDPSGDSAVEHIKDKIKELINRERQWEEEVTSTRARNAELARQNIEINRQKGDLQDELDRCQEAKTAVEDNHESDVNARLAIERKLAAFETEALAELQKLNDDIDRREVDQANANRLIAELRITINKLETQMKKVQSHNEDIHQWNQELEGKLGECNKSLTTAIDANTRLSTLEYELSSVRDDLTEAENLKNALEEETVRLKSKVNETMNKCLLGLTLKEVPIIDSGIQAAVRETAGELISHYERNMSQSDRNRVEAFKLIGRSVREFIRNGKLDVSPLENEGMSDSLKRVTEGHIKGIREVIKDYVFKSDVMAKMPSNTVALSMRRITENIISVAKSVMFKNKYDDLRSKLTSITKAAEKTMANDITAIINKAFDAVLGINTPLNTPSTEVPHPIPITWGSLIHENAGPVSVLFEIPDDIYDVYHDAAKKEDESPDDSYMEQGVIRLSRLDIVGKLSDMMDSSEKKPLNWHELECILFLTYIIGMDLIGGSENRNPNESDMYNKAGALLKQRLGTLAGSKRQASTRSTVPAEARYDSDPGANIDLEKLSSHIQARMNQADIEPMVIHLTNKIMKEMQHTREERSHVISNGAYIEIDRLMIEAESYNNFHITKSRSSTPIPAPRSSHFGLYV
jgi:chromosome segregation ATPase